ncbi:MAG: hypothetical protein LBR34_11595, partial [Prevotella sp.]|nr:hypothetical protein [Prevotella sp.]
MLRLRFLFISFLLFTGITLFAQNKSLLIYRDGSIVSSIDVSQIDSIKFGILPEPPEPPELVNPVIPLLYVDIMSKDSAYYEAVRIGEYLWMNRNFNHYSEVPVTRAQLNKVLHEYRLDSTAFTVSIDDFNTYYGQYHSIQRFLHMNENGYVYEGTKRKLLLNPETNLPEWKLPDKSDYRQLFAMCGDASEYAVRTTLACRPYENPAAIPITYWIGMDNTNRYGFNCMPGGARHHAEDTWSTCFGVGDCPVYYNYRGDFYITFMAVRWVSSEGTVSIHDYPDTGGGLLWHLQNARWRRRLTDEELGYKLYFKVKNMGAEEWNAIASEYLSAATDYIAE